MKSNLDKHKKSQNTQLYYNHDKNKYFIMNNMEGTMYNCDPSGQKFGKFLPTLTGQ